jgi:hypothetical protein
MTQEIFGGYPFPKYALTKEEETALDSIHNKFGLLEDFKVEFGSPASTMLHQLETKFYASMSQNGPKCEIWYIHKRDDSQLKFKVNKNNSSTEEPFNPSKGNSIQKNIWQ